MKTKFAKGFRPVVWLMLGLALLATPVLGGAAFAQGAQVEVSAVDDAFQPQTITVDVGDTVVWTNQGSMPHTVTADDGSFDSGTLDPGATFSQAFNSPGSFAYHCTFHGAAGGIGMAGVVVVQAAAQAAPPAPGEPAVVAQIEAPQIEEAPPPAAAQTPAALPSTGEPTEGYPWLVAGALGMVLAAGGFAVRSRA